MGHSGRQGDWRRCVAKKIAKFGVTATKEQVAEITKRVKREASLRKWSISDDVLEIIAKDVLGGDDASFVYGLLEV
jgi:isopropylmalate/homocitrate/citramalate synthase